MKLISATELASWLADGKRERPLLLDVREPWENAICRIEGSELVPMRDVAARLAALDTDRPIVCICHLGGRSAHAAVFLERQGCADVYNLTGGVEAWRHDVDPTMTKY